MPSATRCTCNYNITCSTIGELDPSAFLCFIGAGLIEAKKQVNVGGGYSKINAEMTWINCQGHIWSTCWDITGQDIPKDMQRKRNLVAVLDLCDLYIGQRFNAALRKSAKGDRATRDWVTIASCSVEQARLATMQQTKVPVTQILNLLELVNIWENETLG